MSTPLPIPESTRETIVVATAGQTTFAYGFPIQFAQDLVVQVRVPPLLAWGPRITHGAGMTVSGAGQTTGRQFVLDVPLAAGTEVRIRGEGVIQRLSDILAGAEFDARAIENEFDRIFVLLQEGRRDTGQALAAVGTVAADAAAASAAAATATAQANTATTQAGNASTSASQAAASLGTINLQRRRVLTRGANTAPGSPATGDQHVVGTAPTGAWAGQANAIASWSGTAWTFLAPQTGQEVFSVADGQDFVWNGTTWATPPTALAARQVAPDRLQLVAPSLLSADTTLTTADENETVALTGSTARTFTLPAATVGVGFVIELANLATADLTIAAQGADTVDGAATTVIPPGTAAVAIVTAAGTWRLFGTRGRLGGLNDLPFARIAAAALATAAEYRSKTASKLLSAVPVWDAAAPVALTDAATIAVDLATGLNFTVTLAGNRTLGNPTNAFAGQTGVIRVAQDATGGRTLSFAANWRPGSPALTIGAAANRVTVLTYYVHSASEIEIALIRDRAP